MRHLTAFGALVAAFAFSTPLVAEEAPRAQAASVVPGVAAPPMTAEDLVTLPRLGAPAVNREGTLAVYSVTVTDPASLKRAPTHYLIDLARPGAAPVALDLGLKASDLAFGPDGALYFLSSEHTDAAAPARSRVFVAIISGMAAGVMGFTGLVGFLTFFVTTFILSLGMYLKVGGLPKPFFKKGDDIWTEGIMQALMVRRRRPQSPRSGSAAPAPRPRPSGRRLLSP